jgi:hypothetical protein
MRRRRRTHQFAWVAAFALALLAAGHAWADCSFADLTNAITSTPSFVKNNADCAEHLGNPAFLPVSGAVTAAVKSSSDAKSACKEIMNLDAKASGYQEKVQALDKLPQGIRKDIYALPGVKSASEAAADLDKALSFAKCACALATESGPAQLIDVGGDCLKAGMCWVFDLAGESCDSCPALKKPPLEKDCANNYDDLQHDPYYGTLYNNYLFYDDYTICDGDFCFNKDLTAGGCAEGRITDYC